MSEFVDEDRVTGDPAAMEIRWTAPTTDLAGAALTEL